jgi:hypothetical protein
MNDRFIRILLFDIAALIGGITTRAHARRERSAEGVQFGLPLVDHLSLRSLLGGRLLLCGFLLGLFFGAPSPKSAADSPGNCSDSRTFSGIASYRADGCTSAGANPRTDQGLALVDVLAGLLRRFLLFRLQL